MEDECSDRLIAAMRLLGMQIDPATRDPQFTHAVLVTVRELVQRAWHLHKGHKGAAPISENTQILLNTLVALDAIEYARRRD